MRSQLSWLKNILIDPKKSRIVFDLGFILLVSLAFNGVARVMQHDVFELWVVVAFPALLVVVNYLFGLYTTHTTSPLVTKASLLLLASTFATLVFLNPLEVNGTL